MPTSVDVLRASIEAHNDTFEALLRLIPPKYYLVKDEDADGAVRFLFDRISCAFDHFERASVRRPRANTKNTARTKRHPSKQ
jgi:hypothetical protein